MADKKKKKIYRAGFTSVGYGFYEVEASSPEEAEEVFESGDYDQFDNKSDTEITSGWEEN